MTEVSILLMAMGFEKEEQVFRYWTIWFKGVTIKGTYLSRLCVAVPGQSGVTTNVLDIDEDKLSLCLNNTISHEIIEV